MAGESNSLFDNLPPPTAAPQGWWGGLFGSPERRAAQPQSRGAMLGANYQGMPNARSTITDVRNAPDSDQAAAMRQDPVGTSNYAPSMTVSPRQAWDDQMLSAGPTLSQGNIAPDPSDPYQASFKQNWHPRVTGPAPYNPFRIPRPYGDETFGPGNMGPNLPRGGGDLDTSVGGGSMGYPSDLPYIGAHLPIAPGDPHWTPPPSPSGPHNRQGDPARPGYDSPMLPMGMGQISPDQMQNALQLWQTGQ